MKLKLNNDVANCILSKFIESYYASFPILFLEKYCSKVEYNKKSKTYIGHFGNSNIVNILHFTFGGLSWNYFLNSNKIKTGTSFLDLCSSMFFLDNESSIIKMSNDLGIDLYAAPKLEHVKPCVSHTGILKLIPNTINILDVEYGLTNTFYCYNFDGSISGAIFQWRNGIDYLELPLFYREIGLKNEIQLFLCPEYRFKCFNNRNLLDLYRDSVVILCEDYVLSEKINAIIDESKRISFSKYCSISFSYVSESSFFRNLNCLKSRDVVYLPNGSSDCFLNLQILNQVKAVARSLKVQKDIVFFDDGSYKPADNVSDRFGDHLVRSARIVDDFGSGLICDIVRTAVAYDEYCRWGEFIGIFDKTNHNPRNYFCKFDTFDYSLALDRLKPSLESLFLHSNFTLLYGEKNSSKSLFLITILYALASGFDVFDIVSLNSKRVLMVDFSSHNDTFTNKLLSVHLPYRKNKPISSDFFALIMNHIDLIDKFDLASENFQNFIENHIVESRCEVLAFDNFPFSTKHGDSFVEKWVDVSEWLNHIRNKYGIGIIFCYESSSKNDIFFENINIHQFSNVINIERLNRQAPSSFHSCEKYDNSSENLIHIQYEYILNFVKLDKSDSYYCKSIGDNSVSSKWTMVPNSKFKNNLIVDNVSKQYMYEQKVLNYLKLKKENDVFLRKEIDVLLNKGSGTSRNILNGLIDKKLIEKIGDKSRSIEYRYIRS